MKRLKVVEELCHLEEANESFNMKVQRQEKSRKGMLLRCLKEVVKCCLGRLEKCPNSSNSTILRVSGRGLWSPRERLEKGALERCLENHVWGQCLEKAVQRNMEHLNQLGQLWLLLHTELAVTDKEIQGNRNTRDLEVLEEK